MRVLDRNYGVPIRKEAYSTDDMGGAGQTPQSLDQSGKGKRKKCGHKGKCSCPIEMPAKVGKAAPRDADSDGWINEGTPGRRYVGQRPTLGGHEYAPRGTKGGGKLLPSPRLSGNESHRVVAGLREEREINSLHSQLEWERGSEEPDEGKIRRLELQIRRLRSVRR